MRIGEVARASGVSARSLRYYEQRGLLSSTRSANGYREYDGSAVERARTLQLLFGLGVPRDLATSVLACAAGATPEQHRSVHDDLDRLRRLLDEHAARLHATSAAIGAVLDAQR